MVLAIGNIVRLLTRSMYPQVSAQRSWFSNFSLGHSVVEELVFCHALRTAHYQSHNPKRIALDQGATPGDEAGIRALSQQYSVEAKTQEALMMVYEHLQSTQSMIIKSVYQSV